MQLELVDDIYEGASIVLDAEIRQKGDHELPFVTIDNSNPPKLLI